MQLYHACLVTTKKKEIYNEDFTLLEKKAAFT